MRRAAALLLGALLACGPAQNPALAAPRVASINLCTDQLLLDLAAPGQIAGLSPYAADAVRASGRAGPFRLLSGTAEDVLVLKPDIVVTSRFSGAATKAMLRTHGIRVEEFDVIPDFAEARRQILRVGELTGNAEQAAARVAELDAAIAELKARASRQNLRVLPLSRRGWVSGGRSLTTEILALAGLGNAAAELGIEAGGFVGLEAIVKLKPDAILVAREDGRAEDQGQALLLHPAIETLFPPERRLHIPERMTLCGGPALATALRQLADQVGRLAPR